MIDRQASDDGNKNNFPHSILDLTETAVGLVKSYGYRIKMDFPPWDQLLWKN